MLDPGWVIAGAALSLVGSISYAYATLIGAARPNVVTWSLWAAVPMVAFSAQMDSGVGLPALMTLSAGVGPSIVLISALLSRHMRVRVGVFDVVCGVVATSAVVVWLGLGRAPVAVLVAIVADSVALLPTLRKAWRDSVSERIEFYALVAVGAAITLLTITSWGLQEWAFAAYQLAACIIVIGVLARGRLHIGESPDTRSYSLKRRGGR
ncbi:hypothetical protein [Jongsikchunia kroppenstedtii]|uniref:hypothetical protein n=1 Tax=Jongsikchunia kroppenstedtii TaxID=1121721 RepID=UPI000382D68A|nr:hypothetical protein [Jongsikchunia kroppenstedtii]